MECFLFLVKVGNAMSSCTYTMQAFAAFGKDLERQRHVCIAVRIVCVHVTSRPKRALR
jgi:hypothetical protein